MICRTWMLYGWIREPPYRRAKALRTYKYLPAVEVKQNARPARHDEPMVPNTPARGRVRIAPIARVRIRDWEAVRSCSESQPSLAGL